MTRDDSERPLGMSASVYGITIVTSSFRFFTGWPDESIAETVTAFLVKAVPMDGLGTAVLF